MEITADIRWSGATNADQTYSRTHEWRFDGGAIVAASAAPAIVPPPATDPALVDPEEAMVAAVSSCHMLFYLALASSEGLVVEGYTDTPVGVMARDAAGRMSIVSITLAPQVRFADADPDPETDRALHDLAHTKCFIANSIRADVRVKL